MSESEYRIRQHAFEKERLWRVGPDGLSWDGGDKKGHFPFSEIVSIRLSYTPTRFDFARYRCVVTRFNGWREAIVSTSYAGIGSFEDRAPAYARFVRSLVAHAAKGNPAIRFEAGEFASQILGKHRDTRRRLRAACTRHLLDRLQSDLVDHRQAGGDRVPVSNMPEVDGQEPPARLQTRRNSAQLLPEIGSEHRQ